jgi:hypothetical protein
MRRSRRWTTMALAILALGVAAGYFLRDRQANEGSGSAHSARAVTGAEQRRTREAAALAEADGLAQARARRASSRARRRVIRWSRRAVLAAQRSELKRRAQAVQLASDVRACRCKLVVLTPLSAAVSAPYLNWGPRQGRRRVVVVGGLALRSVDARPYLGPRPGQGR